jgi:hypothetical protein
MEIPENRKRTLTLAQMHRLYHATEKPERISEEVEVTEELWTLAITPAVRKFMALQLEIPYESFQEMVARLKAEDSQD